MVRINLISQRNATRMQPTHSKACSRPLLDATIALNLVF